MNFKQYLNSGSVLYLDGAMGTLLAERGLNLGERPEKRNIDRPQDIIDIHAEYFKAGANAVITNTFGVNAFKYCEEDCKALIEAAVKNAKIAREQTGGKGYVGLDVGPSGKMLKPFGDLDFEQAIKTFKISMAIGVQCGVDFIFIETFSDLAETKAAVIAAKETCDLPIIVSNAYGEDGKLLSGSSPQAVAAMLEGLGVSALGCNCSFGPKELLPVLRSLAAATDLPLVFKANAGLPSVAGGKVVYDLSAKEFAKYCAKAKKTGAIVLGGCCGTTPEYVKELVSSCGKTIVKNRKIKKRTVVSSSIKAVTVGEKPLIIGERINPTGKNDVKEAIKRGDLSFAAEQAVMQTKSGADILDVNVGVPGTDEPSVLKETVLKVQSAVDVPLCIDTSNVAALESAMRVYAGKPLVNSVNGKSESMEAVFPLVKKYGGAVICLTLDERGIPKTAKERISIAKKIILEAEKYGVNKSDLVFDALTMAVSADPDAANVCLKTLAGLKKLGLKTVLGVSNVSFGLPMRSRLTAAFLSAALSTGLDMAIADITAAEIESAMINHLALTGKDRSFSAYSSFAAKTVSAEKSAAITPLSAKIDSQDDLKQAIIDGLKEKSAAIAKQYTAKKSGLKIIEQDIMPALDFVGAGFEKKTVYLPQLLLSAECAKAAFDIVKKTFGKSQSGDKNIKIVLATVKGDVHDIGKNIVRLLLENYGFTVVDLGKDVEPEAVVKAVEKERADLLGLSALMTTTVTSMQKTTALVKKSAPYCKVMVGGAVLTEDYALSIGADYYAKDATVSVKIAEKIENEKNLKR